MKDIPLRLMRMIKKCRIRGITHQGINGVEYTQLFIHIVFKRRYGTMSLRSAAAALGISKSCYLIREKDCIRSLADKGSMPDHG